MTLDTTFILIYCIYIYFDDCEDLTDRGKLFHNLGPCIARARSPYVVFELGTNRLRLFSDLREYQVLLYLKQISQISWGQFVKGFINNNKNLILVSVKYW